MSKLKILNDHTYSQEGGCEEDHTHNYCDRGHESTNNQIKGFQIVVENEHYDIETTIDINPNLKYYILYCIYSSGDSFGSSSGHIEVIDFYNHTPEAYEMAKETAKAIRKNSDIQDHIFSIKARLGNGKKYDIYCPWVGYFERLDNVIVETIRSNQRFEI